MNLVSVVFLAVLLTCEQTAFEIREKYNTDLVFAQSIDSNGAYSFSDDGKKAHWLNAKTIGGKRYYFDFSQGDSRIFTSKADIQEYLYTYLGYSNKHTEVYDFGIGDIPPFAIHYQWQTN